ncbi:serine protease easter-like [Contarinia nasturtii]|uniref:serine protease easter-like n=1 Tax=Contarinia nasturtii TaxID=265458 RepID=UPI0012D3CD6E|nr:serine protease easter-like [Contarinia nasturtii]
MLHYAEIITVLLICYFSCWTSAQNPCITPDGFQGYCIDLRECEPLFKLLKNPNLSIQQITYLRNAQCGYQNLFPWVCCANQQQQPSTIQLPRPGVCGSQLQDRIIGGEETRITEFPWMALIEYTKPTGRGYHCGGVLINEQYVLTASHCVNGKDLQLLKWTLSGVRLGEWDQRTERDCDDGNCSDPVQDIEVVERIPHKNYNSNSKAQENDIALLRLARPVSFTDWVKPICLPIGNDIANKNFDGLPLIVAGWGKTENASSSSVKLKVEIDGVSLSQCNNVYQAQNVVLTNKQLCAGGQPAKDSCRGDSGGPLMSQQKHNLTHVYYFLAGVVSFGPSPCGLPGWPGVYTRVDQYIDWILQNIRP